MDVLKSGSDTLFLLLGAVMVLAMHAGFAFLELGTVRSKNQVNALVKILTDFAVSTVAYFCVGYGIAYGVSFFVGAEELAQRNGYSLPRKRLGFAVLQANVVVFVPCIRPGHELEEVATCR